METLWERIKKGFRTGVSTTVEKTEELTRIGKLKLDISATKRDITRNFTELGKTVYQMITEQRGTEIPDSQEVRRLTEKVKVLEFDLKEKEDQLEKIREEKKGKEPEEEPPA